MDIRYKNTKIIKREQRLSKYSAVVKEGKRLKIIADQEYRNKKDFIVDLRRNGYKVNPKKVKESNLFNYIMDYTNCNPWDWELKKIPTENKSICEL